MKLGEVVVIHVYYNFTKFHQNWMKNKKVLLIAHLTDVLSVKVLLRDRRIWPYRDFKLLEIFWSYRID